MKIGDLTEKITLQKSILVYDGVSGQDITWHDEAVLHASVKPLKPIFLLEGNQFGSNNVFKVKTHYRKDLTGDTAEISSLYRIVWKGRIMKIQGASVMDQKYMFMELDCFLTDELAEPEALPTPVMTYAEPTGSDEIMVAWSYPYVADSFTVEYGIGGFTESVVVSGLSTKISGLIAETQYSFRVTATTGLEDSPVSNVLTATTDSGGIVEPWRFPDELTSVANDGVFNFNGLGEYSIRYTQGGPTLNITGDYAGFIGSTHVENHNLVAVLTDPNTGASLHGFYIQSNSQCNAIQNGNAVNVTTAFLNATRGSYWGFVVPRPWSFMVRRKPGDIMEFCILMAWEFEAPIVVSSWAITDGFTGYGLKLIPSISNRKVYLHKVMSNYKP